MLSLCVELFDLGAVHKRRPESWGEGAGSVRTFFGQGGEGASSDAALFGEKTSDFLKFRTDEGGLSKGVGRGKFFAILCGRLLWTAPYLVLFSHPV